MDSRDEKWIKWMEYGHRLGCHQMAERSFFIRGYQFPVCARCTGVIIGEAAAILLLLCKIKLALPAACGLLLLMGADWLIQYSKLRESTNIRRLITGISGGVGLTYLYYYAIVGLVYLVKEII